MSNRETTASSRIDTTTTPNDNHHHASPFVSSLLLFADTITSTTTNTNKNDWIDVTRQFQQCAQQLTPQRPFLCQETSFHLYDAMAASQLGHEKMDCCQIPAYPTNMESNNENSTQQQQQQPQYAFPRPPPTGLHCAFTPLLWDTWTESQVLGFALQILVQLQALCAGASVGESTFTCLYVHAPVLQDMEERLLLVASSLEGALSEQCNLKEDKGNDGSNHTPFQGTPTQFLVYTLSLSLLEITKLFRSIVQNADIYEEEDFVAQTYQIPFYTSSSSQDTTKVLATALNVISECKEIEASMGCILSFWWDLCLVFRNWYAKLSTDCMQEQVKSAQAIVRKSVEALDLLLEQHLLETLPSAPAQAFDPYVIRPRVGNAPVRQVRVMETRQAIASLRDMTHEMDWAVCNVLCKANSAGRLRRMLEHVSRNKVNILSRSLIVLNLYFEDRILGQFEMVQWIWEDLLECSALEEESDRQVLETVHGFLQRLAKPVYDTFKLQTLNRNRQRAYMDVIMFPEWASLQMEAQALDAHLCATGYLQSTSPMFTQYALVVVLRLMVQYISVGFELDLYCSHDDIGFAYWYLDFLLSGLLTHLSAMKQSKEMARMEKRIKETKQQESSTGNINSSSKGNQRNKKKSHRQKNNHAVETVPPNSYKPTSEDLEMDLEMSIFALKRNLCRGSLRFLVALQQTGILTEKNHAFTSKQRIFEERFRAFLMIRQPPPLMYEQYVQGSDFSKVTPEELQQSTCEWFQSCKRAVEHLLSTSLPSVDVNYAPIREAELKSLLKVSIGNNVYLLKLRQVLQDPTSASSVRVEFDNKTHDQYCTIKLF